MVEVFNSELPSFDCRLKARKGVNDYSAWRTHMKILIIEDDENMVDYIKKYSISVGLKQSLFAYKGKMVSTWSREKCRMWCC